MSYRCANVQFEIQTSEMSKQMIVCDYYLRGSDLSYPLLKSEQDMVILLSIRYHDNFGRRQKISFTFNEANTVSGFSYLNFEKFQEKVRENNKPLNTYYYESIAPQLDLEKMYDTYTKYMNRVLGQFGI